jgi:hypothetical protein
MIEMTEAIHTDIHSCLHEHVLARMLTETYTRTSTVLFINTCLLAYLLYVLHYTPSPSRLAQTRGIILCPFAQKCTNSLSLPIGKN